MAASAGVEVLDQALAVLLVAGDLQLEAGAVGEADDAAIRALQRDGEPLVADEHAGHARVLHRSCPGIDRASQPLVSARLGSASCQMSMLSKCERSGFG